MVNLKKSRYHKPVTRLMNISNIYIYIEVKKRERNAYDIYFQSVVFRICTKLLSYVYAIDKTFASSHINS